MAANKNQLWELIEQITLQIEDLMNQDEDTKNSLIELADKLKRLIDLHKQCQEAEKNMRAKQLSLMRERNLYLEKCKKIENIGKANQWMDDKNLLSSISKILYSSDNTN